MSDEQDDRRVQRTKRLLHQALMSLVTEKPYEKITVQDVIDRADVGRTTFYTHFQSKEDLFLSSHEHLIDVISRSLFFEGDGLHDEPAPEFVGMLEMLGQQSRDAYFHLTWGNESGAILRRLKERIAAQLTLRLRELFDEAQSSIPFVVLAQQIANSLVGVSSWWLDKRMPFSAQELTIMLHQMNLAVLRQVLRK